MKNHNHIIVIDDESNVRKSIKSCLSIEGFIVDDFESPERALTNIENTQYDLAIIDIRLKNSNGIDLFQSIQSIAPSLPAIFISGNASLDEAVKTIKVGAFDFLEKPFSAEKLIITVKNCLELNLLKQKVSMINQENNTIIGENKSIKKLKSDILQVAKTDATVFVSGESGTGKELIAQSIHQYSQRSEEIFTKVNCSAIPVDLIDSALFGHVKGAFTGADKQKKGFFEACNGGTLFLDEIGDLPFESQSSLLRVLENNEVQKVGSDTIEKVDVRIITASHKDLKKAVEEGSFREDLFYRINIIPLVSPPLRERISDLPLLVHYFIEKACRKYGIKEKSMSTSCINQLQKYSWPGNIRELINIIERMVIMGHDHLTPDDIPLELTESKNKSLMNCENMTLKQYRETLEKEFLEKKIIQFNGNMTQLANALVMDRTYLYRVLSKYGLKPR